VGGDRGRREAGGAGTGTGAGAGADDCGGVFGRRGGGRGGMKAEREELSDGGGADRGAIAWW
jgi:hypothetical protein